MPTEQSGRGLGREREQADQVWVSATDTGRNSHGPTAPDDVAASTSLNPAYLTSVSTTLPYHAP